MCRVGFFKIAVVLLSSFIGLASFSSYSSENGVLKNKENCSLTNDNKIKIMNDVVFAYCDGYYDKNRINKILNSLLFALPGTLECIDYEYYLKIIKRLIYLIDLSLDCHTIDKFKENIKSLTKKIEEDNEFQISFKINDSILNECFDLYFFKAPFGLRLGNKHIFKNIDVNFPGPNKLKHLSVSDSIDIFDWNSARSYFYKKNKKDKNESLFYKTSNGEILLCEVNKEGKPYLYKEFVDVIFKNSFLNERYIIYFTGEDCKVCYDMLNKDGIWKFNQGI